MGTIERGSPEWLRRMAQLHENMDEHIARVGHSVMGVGGGESSPAFCYTIGLQAAGLPELLVFGGYAGPFHEILNIMALHMRDKGVYPDGQPILDVGSKLPLVAVHATDPDTWEEYTYQATRHYKTRDYRVVQLVCPDKEGRFPWDPGCAEPYSRQPILGATPTYTRRPN